MKHYGDDASVVFKHFPLNFHKSAKLAAEAAMAAHAQGKFWEYQEILFQNQKALERVDLEKYAQQIGLDMTKFRSDLDNKKYEARVEQDIKLGNTVGVGGTPTIFVNGRLLNGPKDDAQKLIELIDREILKKN